MSSNSEEQAVEATQCDQLEAIYKAISTFGEAELVPQQYVAQLPLDQLWQSEDGAFTNPKSSFYLSARIFQRYNEGGSHADLLCSVLFAEQTLEMLSQVDEPKDSPEVLEQFMTAKASAAVQLAERQLCVYEWSKKHTHYLAALLAAAMAVKIASDSKSWVKGYALTVMSMIYRAKWEDGHVYEDFSDCIGASTLAMECGDRTDNSWPKILANHAGNLSLRYEKTKNKKDIEKALELTQETYNLAKDDSSRVQEADRLAVTFRLLALDSGSDDETTKNIDRAIDYLKIALRLMPPDSEGKWLLLVKMTSALMLKSEISQAEQDLLGAIFFAREALVASFASPELAKRLTSFENLSEALENHYRKMTSPEHRNLEEIDEAIKISKEAMSMYEDADFHGRPKRTLDYWNKLVMNLARRIYLKFEQTHDASDAEEAALLGTLILQDDGSESGTAFSLQSLSINEARRSNDGVGSKKAIIAPSDEICRRKLDPDTTPESDKDTVDRDEEESGSFDPLRIRERYLPEDDPFFSGIQSSSSQYWGNANFLSWFENISQWKNEDCVLWAIPAIEPSGSKLAERLSEILKGTEPEATRYCQTLSYVYEEGYNLKGFQDSMASYRRWCAEHSWDLLESLISCLTQAEQFEPVQKWIEEKTEAHWAPLMQKLAGQLSFDDQDKFYDLKTDLRFLALQKAVILTPTNAEKHAEYLSDLARAHQVVFQYRGSPLDFIKAMECAEKAVKISHMSGTYKRNPSVAFPLIRLLSESYESTDSLATLEKATELAAEATLFSNESDQIFLEVLDLLGYLLLLRWKRTKSQFDFDASFTLAKKALSSTRMSRRHLVAPLLRIAALSTSRYTLFEKPEDLDRQISVCDIVFRITPLNLNDPQAFQNLANASVAFRRRFERASDKTSRKQDIDKAIAVEEIAVLGLNDKLSVRCKQLFSLGLSYEARFEAVHDESDQQKALQMFLQASSDSMQSHPMNRIMALRMAAKVQHSIKRYEDALHSLENAINILSDIVHPDMSPEDRQSVLSEISGRLPNDAAAMAILTFGATGYGPFHAMELLEKGRGLIIGTIIEERGEAKQLSSISPELYKEFRGLQQKLAASREPRYNNASYHAGNVQQETNIFRKRMKELLKQIRNFEGLGHFLLTPTSEDLLKILKEGTIIMVFHSIICQKTFAIILAKGETSALELPRMTTESIHENITRVVDIRFDKNKNLFKKNQKMLPVLEWLWNAAVMPITEALGYQKNVEQRAENLPRIWWIGAGIIANLPFHAAGLYQGDHHESTMDVCLSTYIPTIKSLLYATEKELVLPDDPKSKNSFITMENTPGYKPLEGVEEEAQNIRNMFPEGRWSLFNGSTAEKVAHEIHTCDNIHLSCHGESDIRDASKSFLVLVRTDPDATGIQRQDKLFVSSVFQESTRGSGIAFLSACHTADNPDPELSDESIHLASAFQLAGFSHVVGTLWSTRNSSCRRISEAFYQYLLEESKESRHKRVAVALHKAVQDLRKDCDQNPLLWASFIHIGA